MLIVSTLDAAGRVFAQIPEGADVDRDPGLLTITLTTVNGGKLNLRAGPRFAIKGVRTANMLLPGTVSGGNFRVSP